VSQSPKQSLRDVKLGANVRIFDFVNLYECEIGDNSRIGTFVEIQKNAKVGRNVKVSSHTFICEGVTIEDEVFIGHSVSFINDRHPRATTAGRLQTDADWQCVPTLVKRGASIGTSATIMCGITIGENAVVGAGSVVTHDVPAGAVVAGVPARLLRRDAPITTKATNGPGTAPAPVPFVDLKAQHRALRNEIRDAVDRVVDSSVFALGESVAAFERAFAAYCGATHGVGVNSGASALHLALLAAGVDPGDEVITVPFTFVATVAAIQYVGARPVLVDIDPTTYTMDVERLAAAITPRTKAIIPVHLYGQPADMDPILDIARRHGVVVIEDAAQAHGAQYKGRRAGSIGQLGCFSFYPAKNLGACGEAGMVVTNDPEYARRIRILRDWGQAEKYVHALRGYNFRMDAIQGAILGVKLGHLDTWIRQRQAHAARYDRLLEDSEVRTPSVGSSRSHVYHIYAVRVAERERVRRALQERGIHTGIHYPIPVHLQPAYTDLGYGPGDFPCSEMAAREVLSLPLFPELSDSQVDRVVTGLREVVDAVRT
jgi:dTDP-4-amino-4,6-dideoxygalactose transaminase/acetyltransferase-like isoleucine patch superfamily enzyme